MQLKKRYWSYVMKKVKLVIKEDTSGQIGLCFKRKTKHFGGVNIIYTGIQFAHDLIEHQNGINAIGTFEDEFEAIGGTWYVRGELGDFVTTNKSPYELLATDLTNLLEEYTEFCNRKLKMDGFIKTNDDDEILDSWKAILSYMHSSIHFEDDFLECATAGFISGFLKAEERFGNTIEANNAFNELCSIYDATAVLLPDEKEGLLGLELPLKIPKHLREYIHV